MILILIIIIIILMVLIMLMMIIVKIMIAISIFLFVLTFWTPIMKACKKLESHMWSYCNYFHNLVILVVWTLGVVLAC